MSQCPCPAIARPLTAGAQAGRLGRTPRARRGATRRRDWVVLPQRSTPSNRMNAPLRPACAAPPLAPPMGLLHALGPLRACRRVAAATAPASRDALRSMPLSHHRRWPGPRCLLGNAPSPSAHRPLTPTKRASLGLRPANTNQADAIRLVTRRPAPAHARSQARAVVLRASGGSGAGVRAGAGGGTGGPSARSPDEPGAARRPLLGQPARLHRARQRRRGRAAALRECARLQRPCAPPPRHMG